VLAERDQADNHGHVQPFNIGSELDRREVILIGNIQIEATGRSFGDCFDMERLLCPLVSRLLVLPDEAGDLPC